MVFAAARASARLAGSPDSSAAVVLVTKASTRARSYRRT